MGRERHLHEGDDTETEGSRLERGMVAADRTLLLELAAAARTLRRREPHLLRQLVVGEAAITLECVEKLDIEMIHA